MAAFRVSDKKAFITTMAIRSVDQIFVKFYNIVHQVTTEFYYINFSFLANNKFFPS